MRRMIWMKKKRARGCLQECKKDGRRSKIESIR